MPTGLDCVVLRDVFGTEEMRDVFTSRSLVQSWLDAEAALARAEGRAGVIPAAAADEIASACRAELYDLDELREGLRESQHPLVPLVRALVSKAGAAGRWVHWGATTQDIMDTGLVLQLRPATALLEQRLRSALLACARLAEEHAATAQPGRTHGQHAVPITLGLKVASWADEFADALEALRRAKTRVLRAQLGGAAGTLAALGESAAVVRRLFAAELDLEAPDVPWHANRARVRELAAAVAGCMAPVERVAREIIRLQATEIAELSEPLPPGHVGSSTMPQKQNPMMSEYAAAAARLARAAASAVVDAVDHAGERDMASWAVEWLALPQLFVCADGALSQLVPLLEGLVVRPERMRANLELTNGAILAEAAMMSLGQTLGHETAHQLVAAAARRAEETGKSLREVLAETTADVTWAEDQWKAERYIGEAPEIARAAAIRARSVAGDTAPGG